MFCVGDLKAERRRLVVETLAISPSGALSPGPLSATAVAVGASLGVIGGLLVAVGHGVAELVFIVLIFRAIERVRGALARYYKLLSLTVIVFLLYFSVLLIRDSIKIYSGGLASSAQVKTFSFVEAFLAGVVFTGANVHFLVWWVSVGYPLIERASRLGASGLKILYVSHVWMDYVWLSVLSIGGSMAELMSSKLYALLLGALAIVLLGFAFVIALSLARGKPQFLSAGTKPQPL